MRVLLDYPRALMDSELYLRLEPPGLEPADGAIDRVVRGECAVIAPTRATLASPQAVTSEAITRNLEATHA
jgi:hypothetical protein